MLSALDSFAAIIPSAWILSRLMGINGLWTAFPVTACVLLAVMILCNLRYASKSGGKLKGLLLYESDEEATPVLDATISSDLAEISGISEKLQKICEEIGIDKRDAIRAALSVEEIAVNAAARKSRKTYADVLVRTSGGRVVIDFRVLGKAFDPLSDEDGKLQENVTVLRSIASDIEYEYLLGMNSTRITL